MTAVEPELAPQRLELVEHIVCCHEPTLALCGSTVARVDGEEPDCVVCLDLEPDLNHCPLGPGACHLAEKIPRKADR